MAEIPYKPVPQVQPVEPGDPQIHETVPHVEISGAVGKALEIVGHGTGVLGEAYKEVGESYDKLGKNFKGAGDELWTRAVALRQLELDKNVDKAELAYTQGNALRMEQALANPNLGPEGMSATIKQSADSRAAGEDALPTEYEKQQFRKRTMPFVTHDARRLASSVAVTERKDLINSAEATVTNLQRQMSIMDPDEPEFKELQDRMEDTIKNILAPAKGMKSGEEVKQKLQDEQDVTRGNQIIRTANTDLDRAMDMLRRSEDKKNEKDYIADPQKRQALIAQLRNKVMDTVPTIAAHNATKDPNVTEKEAGDASSNEGIARGKRLGMSGDDQIKLGNDSRKAAERQVSDMQAASDFTDSKNQNAISKFIVEKDIRRMDQLPKEMQAQIAQMRKFGMQDNIRDLLLRPPPDVPETLENKLKHNAFVAALDGIITPEARKDAMTQNFLTMEGITSHQRNHLAEMQEREFKVGQHAVENVKLKEFFDFAKSNNLLTKTQKDEKGDANSDHGHWMGAAKVGLEQAIAENKGPLNDAQKRELVRKISSGITEFGGKAVYQQEPPDWLVKDYKSHYPNASKEEMQEHYQRYLQRNLLSIIDQLKPGTPPKQAPGGAKPVKTTIER